MDHNHHVSYYTRTKVKALYYTFIYCTVVYSAFGHSTAKQTLSPTLKIHLKPPSYDLYMTILFMQCIIFLNNVENGKKFV
jgi:hypothetical protein